MAPAGLIAAQDAAREAGRPGWRPVTDFVPGVAQPGAEGFAETHFSQPIEPADAPDRLSLPGIVLGVVFGLGIWGLILYVGFELYEYLY
jgi:hypothetical protein